MDYWCHIPMVHFFVHNDIDYNGIYGRLWNIFMLITDWL